MDFDFTSDQIAIQDSVHALMKQFPANYWLDADQEHRFPIEFYHAFAEAGLLGVCIPTEYGGSGLGLTEAALVLAAVSGSGAGLSGTSAVHMSIFGLTPVVKFGSDEMRRRVLPDVVSGKLHVCFGVTEPDAGTDTTRITTFARRDGEHYVINGKKVWTSKAEDSQSCLLLTRTTPRDQCAKPTDGMTLFLVDLDPSAVTIRPIRKMGRHSVSSCEVFYDNLRVPLSARVGEEGQGFKYLLDGLNAERILVAFEAAALGHAGLREAAAYARERKVFGRAIGANQGVQFPLADSLAKLEAADLVNAKAVWMYDRGDSPAALGPVANMAKYLSSEAAFEACDRAVQTLGGYGYASEFHVERYFRETRLWKLAPISQNLVLSYLAERVLQLPRSF